VQRVDLGRRLAAEALGTALLLATVVGSGIMGDRLAGGIVGLALLGNTLATGAILVVLILVFGPLSGAHFNPAVTLSFLVGVLIAHAMFAETLLQVSTTERVGASQWFAEGVATFGLVATIIGTLRWSPAAVAPAVGLYISAGYWFTASTSFANPAVTVARSLTDTFSGIAPGGVPGFVVAQCIGAVLATVVFGWLLSPARETSVIVASEPVAERAAPPGV
jgi:glycerol uptake facilitator-like aquaporin